MVAKELYLYAIPTLFARLDSKSLAEITHFEKHSVRKHKAILQTIIIIDGYGHKNRKKSTKYVIKQT